MIVEVYWNWHRGCWSVRDAKTRRVVAHLSTLALANCRLRVSEKGRQRVLRERRRNVHAFVQGIPLDAARDANAVRITYRPFVDASFVTVAAGEIVRAARRVFFEPERVVWAVAPVD